MSTNPTLSGVEVGKQKAAYQAVDDFVKDDMVVGIGSGSTVVYAVQRLEELVKKHNWKNIVCVPTSFQAVGLIIDANLTLGTLNRYTVVDVTIDGSDECDSQLNCIKGGGACQLQEKLVASNSKTFVVVADSRKDSKKLGEQWKKGVPIEVVPSAYKCILCKLEQLGAEATLRQAGSSKAGPVVTDNGNFIIDAHFGEIALSDVEKLDRILQCTSGIVETGLFVNMVTKAYFGAPDGTVKTRSNDKAKAMGDYHANSEHYVFGNLRQK